MKFCQACAILNFVMPNQLQGGKEELMGVPYVCLYILLLNLK